MSEQDLEKTVGEYVAEDFRTAKVFQKYGVDFCCGGNVSLSQACAEKGVDPAALLREMEEAKTEPMERGRNYASWDLSFLIDYIVNNHHGYLKECLHPLAAYTRKIAEVHGEHHPEVIQISGVFEKLAAEMRDHLKAEEELFFPAVKRMEAAKKQGTMPDQKDVALVEEALRTLGSEHEAVGEAVHTIRRLTSDYSVPGDACNTFTVTYRKLEEFEDDLHKHVHLENNILFPKASRL